MKKFETIEELEMKKFETIEELKEWLKNNDLNDLNDLNNTIIPNLFILFCQNNLEVIKYLIKNTDINVNQLNKYEQNILFYDIDLEVIKYLIENTDINVNQVDKYNQNILSFKGDLNIVKYLIENTEIDIKYYLNNNTNIDYFHYDYIKSFYEKRELEKELNKITTIKKEVKKLNKI